MKRTLQLGSGLAAAGLAFAAVRRLRRVQATSDHAKLEADILVGLDEVEAEIARLHAELAAGGSEAELHP